MRDNWILIRILGVIMAIVGTVIIVHTVPVFIWYVILAILIIGLLFILFYS